MTKTEDCQKQDYLKKQAFLFQFGGNESYVKKEIGIIESFSDYGCPVLIMKKMGLFGILEALIDLGLTDKEIRDFYIQNHIDPYDDPILFTEGIIKIVHGMSKTEIKKQYGRYFKDDRIAKIPEPNRNTQMLLSFCYDKDDTYEFIPNKDDLYDKFVDKYYSSRNIYYDGKENNKAFEKIDGKLFRVIRFFVRQGYDFPKIEYLINKEVKDIPFKQTNGEDLLILNKEYVREMSDTLLGLVYFLKDNNYEILNSKQLFNPNCNDIILNNSNGKQIILNRSHLEKDANKYITTLTNLYYTNFNISEITNLCDKRVKKIELTYSYYNNHHSSILNSFILNRDILLSVPIEWFKTIKTGFNLGFTYPNIDNLFNINQEFLKVMDSSGKEYLVIRNQFDSMLEIINICKKYDFSVNLDSLFNANECMVEIFRQDKTAVVNRNRIKNMMTTFSLLTNNGYSFKDYNNLFDENEAYIIGYDKQGQERLLSRKQIYKIIKLQNILNTKSEDLTDSEKNLLSILNNNSIKSKLFEWLPYTAKKWIPSSAVINKIPANQSSEYFYNNNHTRLKVLKNEYQASSYDEMEGIVSLGYILGLFDSKESTSEKAMEYIINYFLKKGVTADQLHTTYGAINLSKGYNKKFADFFMQHYAVDNKAFIEPELGTNMVGEIFDRFDEILETRPEKKIKTRTRNKLLTPKDAMAAIIDIKIDREMLGTKVDDERYIRLAQLLIKFGASKSELKWAIKLYEQALAIDEKKVSVPYIEDINANSMKFTSHLKSAPEVFLSGRKTNCCSTYGGIAQDRLTHVITDPDWRYITFTSPNKTFFDGLVWYDKEQKVVCIDNVEGRFSKIDYNNDKSIAMMSDTVIRYADGIYHKMHELNIPCIKVNVGNDSGTASYSIFEYAKEKKLIYEDNNPCNYPIRNGISTDALKQFTLTDAKILKLRKSIK